MPNPCRFACKPEDLLGKFCPAALSFARTMEHTIVISPEQPVYNIREHPRAGRRTNLIVYNRYFINAVGPRNLSVAAEMTGAKMVQISTDYIFAATLKFLGPTALIL